VIPRPCSAALRALLLASAIVSGTGSATAGEEYTFRFGPSAGAVGGEANIAVLLDVGVGQVPVNAWSMGVCHDASVDIVSVADGGTTASLTPDFQQKQLFPGQGWTVGVVLSFIGTETIPPGSGYALHVARYALLAEGTAAISFCNTLGSPVVETLVTIADASSTTFPPSQIPGAIEIGLIPPFTCSFGAASAAAGTPVDIAIAVDNPVPFDGFALGVRQPAGLLSIDAIAPGAALVAAAGGSGPAFFLVNLAPAGGAESGATVGCLLGLAPPFAQVPAGPANEIAIVTGTIDAGASAGSALAIELTDELGSPPVLTRFTVAGTSVEPISVPGVVDVTGGGGPQFVRGDLSGDGTLTIADAVTLLGFLFGGGAPPGCLDAIDVNDSGGLLLDDAVLLLGYQFAGGPPPAPPFPECGPDPTADAIPCDTPPDCI